MITSVELTPASMRASGSGTLKRTREPVIALFKPERKGEGLYCAVASFHAGLEPGEYELSDGTTIRVPAFLVSAKHEHHTSVTLEVINE